MRKKDVELLSVNKLLIVHSVEDRAAIKMALDLYAPVCKDITVYRNVTTRERQMSSYFPFFI